jgi:hypothetical protein
MSLAKGGVLQLFITADSTLFCQPHAFWERCGVVGSIAEFLPKIWRGQEG